MKIHSSFPPNSPPEKDVQPGANIMENQNRVKRCYSQSIKLEDIFDDTTADTLKNYASVHCIPAEYLICPMITTASHSMVNSTVNPFGQWHQPAALYSTTVGYTGTNKSASFKINCTLKLRGKVTTTHFFLQQSRSSVFAHKYQ